MKNKIKLNLKGLFNEVMGTMTDWFQTTGSKPFTV